MRLHDDCLGMEAHFALMFEGHGETLLKIVDFDLVKVLQTLSEFEELNHKPTRQENSLDPHPVQCHRMLF